MRVVSVMSIVSLVHETKQGTVLRMHSPSATTMKTAQRAIEISKLFAVRTRRENRDSTMLYGAVRTNAVITAKSNRVPSQGLWRQPRRQRKTVLSARLERIDNG